MTARLTRMLGPLVAASLLTFGLAQGCASEGDTNIGDADDDGGAAQTGGGGIGAGDSIADGGTGPGAGGAGGTGENPFECGEEISEANLENLPADLIVVVDNSDSMAFEAGQVKDHINGLVSAITATGIDAHVVLISEGSDNFFFNILDTGVCIAAPLGSGSCPDDENLPAYRHIDTPVDSDNALQLVLSTYDQWKDSLRPNATKTFLVISDDDSGMSAADFTAGLAGLADPITDFKFNAITASESPVSCAIQCDPFGIIGDCNTCTNPCCDKALACIPLSADQGLVYEELQSTTSGVYGDLCEQNFIPAFNDMAQAVINHTQISCTFDLPNPPNSVIVPTETNVDFIPAPGSTPQAIFNVASGADCTINGGWYFDNNTNPNDITLCQTTCDNVKQSTNGSVRVKYGCLTEQAPN